MVSPTKMSESPTIYVHITGDVTLDGSDATRTSPLVTISHWRRLRGACTETCVTASK